MINDKLSLILCGVLAGSIFVFGILDVLDNYIVKTFLTIIFLVIVSNFFVVYSKKPKEEKEQKDLSWKRFALKRIAKCNNL